MAALDRAVRRYETLRELLRQLGERQGSELSQELARLAQELLRVVGVSTDATGPAVRDTRTLLLELDGAIDQARQRFMDLYGPLFAQVGQETVAGTAGVYGAFGRTTAQRLADAKTAFLEARGETYNAGFARWLDEFQDVTGKLRQGIARSLQQAELDGWGQRELVRSLLQNPAFQFENLPPLSRRGKAIFTMGDRLGESDALVRRAHMIARTEANWTANSMHRQWTKAAGFDRYMNINSDPVAVECKEANEQPPMTWGQWGAWTASNGRGGLAPRHPNCDSGMLAVP